MWWPCLQPFPLPHVSDDVIGSCSMASESFSLVGYSTHYVDPAGLPRLDQNKPESETRRSETMSL